MSLKITTRALCLTNLTQSVSTLSHLLPSLNLSHLQAMCRDVLPINLNRERRRAYVDAMVAVSFSLNIGMTGGCRKTHTHQARTLRRTIARIRMPGDTPTNYQNPKLARRAFDRLDSCMYRFGMFLVADSDEVIRRSSPIYHPRIA
ncbi:hypothetical protein COCSADRAFT_36046 [Bipolaris sorokiniana ND90Pr]|uniref:Uncharacterized protein n=1 Tax=Cochliobolus sativus (strain ND90Pr / ATCC 201652) TaxID=665912 RepID=M2T634_COCSN|nr:uncharacterized protein COCSADRAFT_36046 [Bipolaris sorokiniana ND90Pr]EMD64671.1 hypothetical protein COCSADRAFT_36046 [Bipolaris sorokiniana ND90Pr]